jgi:glycosyltransferase involved in cell wall biosynthesis
VDYKNIGKVRNFAVQQSIGAYVTMLDCDDLILPGSLTTIIKVLQENKPELLLTKLREISSLKQIDKNWSFSAPVAISQKECTVKILKHKDLQCHFIGQIIKRSLLMQIPFPEFICYEDAFLFPEIVKKSHNILYAKDSFYLYLKNNDSLSRSLTPEKIKLLCLATENMDRLFFQEYKNFLSVHWIIIFEKYHHWLQGEDFYQILLAKIKRIDFWPFLLDPKIRLSAKRKFLKVRRLLSFSHNK